MKRIPNYILVCDKGMRAVEVYDAEEHRPYFGKSRPIVKIGYHNWCEAGNVRLMSDKYKVMLVRLERNIRSLELKRKRLLRAAFKRAKPIEKSDFS